MTFLPIMERELSVRSRRKATYWMRVVVGGFGALICVVQLNFGNALRGAPSVGQYAFHGLVAAAFLLCCGASVLTVDAISSERREGTLGLLFLTRVRGLDVLLGKLGAAGLMGSCGVIVFLPVLTIPVLSGGVTGGESFRKGLILLDTLFVALAVGLWASACGEAWLASLRKAMLLLLAILVGPLVYGFLTRLLPPWSQTAAAFSPITGLLSAGDQAFRAAPGHYWTSLVLVQLVGWLVLWRAAVLVRRSLREPVVETTEPDEVPATYASATISRRRKPFVHQAEPIHWLLGRQRGLRMAVWTGVLLVLGQWLFYGLFFRFVALGSMAIAGLSWPVSLVVSLAKAALFAWAASRFFVECRHTGAFELLVTTPHGAATITSAHRRMLKHLFRWPIVALVLMNLVQAAPVFWQWFVGAPRLAAASFGRHYAASIGLSCVSIYLQILALCWVGMWFGLKARNQASAIVWTVAIVVVAPTLLSWCVSLGASQVVGWLGQSAGRLPAFAYFSSWFSSVIVMLFYIWLIRRTKRLMSGDLRDVELQPSGLVDGVRELWREGVAAVQRARHWTPS